MSAGRILVVDDDPQIRRVMRVTLIAQGYEVNDARSGEEALEKLRRESGGPRAARHEHARPWRIETCRLIRADSEVAIVMLTVRDAEADQVEALDAGADDYITKPFRTQELLAGIRAALRRAPAGKAAEIHQLTLGPVIVDFDARQVQVGRAPRSLDTQGIRGLRLPGAARQQGGDASRASPGGVGTRLRRRGRLPALNYEPAPQEGRSAAVEPRPFC